MNSTFDIKKFLLKLLANWYLFVLSFSGTYAYFYVKNELIVPTYNAYTTLIVSDEDQSNANKILGGLQLFKSQKIIQDEIAVMKSYSLTSKAISELSFGVSYYEEGRFIDKELYLNAPFEIEVDSSNSRMWTKVWIKLISKDKYTIQIDEDETTKETLYIGAKYEKNGFSFKLQMKEHLKYNDGMKLKRYFFVVNNHESLVNSYSARIKIEPYAPGSSILWLWIVGAVPQKEVDYLNKLVEVYIRQELADKNKIAQNTIRFIDERLTGVVDSLQGAENKLQNFRLQNDIVGVSDKGDGLFKQLEQLQEAKFKADLQLQYYLFLQKEIKDTKNFAGIISSSKISEDDPVLISLLTQLNDYNSEKDILLMSINAENFEKGKTGIADLDVLNMKINKTIESVSSIIYSNIDVTKQTIADVSEKINLIIDDIHQLPSTERKFLQINRKLQLNDNIYTYLLEKRMEAGITQASNKADSKVLDLARVSRVRKQTPNPAQDKGKVLIFGIIIPVLLVFAKGFLNNKISSRSDIEDNIDIPILGTISTNKNKSDLPVVDHPKSSISEAFRALRTNLQYFLVGKKNKIVTVSSSVGGEGKTFFAVNLSAIIAASNQRTLLIGLDLRKPRIHKMIDVSNSVGLSSYLVGDKNMDEIIFETGIINFHVVPSGPIPPNPAELIETQKMADFIQYVKSKYDYVIIDTPPIALVTDALLLSSYSDTNLFIVRQAYTHKNVIKLLNELMHEEYASKLGIVINDVDASNSYEYMSNTEYSYFSKRTHGFGYYSEEPKQSWKQKIIDWFKIR